MIKFELPYNFDPAYVSHFQEPENSQFLPWVEFIYLPAWKDDCQNTRLDVTFRENYPKTYEEYTKRIADLQQLAPVCVLMQKGASLDLIKKYKALGVNKFLINDDALAKMAKKEDPETWVGLSVTRALTLDEIKAGDFSMYDTVVLFYWFNRHLDKLGELPPGNYTIMCNNDCYWDCQWHDAHWFAGGKDAEEYSQNVRKACEECGKHHMELRDSATILPEDLRYFDRFVYSYKLVDRIWDTDRIGFALAQYALRNYGAEPKHTEDFYNIEKPFTEGMVIR